MLTSFAHLKDSPADHFPLLLDVAGPPLINMVRMIIVMIIVIMMIVMMTIVMMMIVIMMMMSVMIQTRDAAKSR